MATTYIIRTPESEPRTVTLVEHEGFYEITLDDETIRVDSKGSPGSPTRSLLIEGRSYEVASFLRKDTWDINVAGDAFQVEVVDELWARAESAGGVEGGGERLISPMPGSVVKVLVEVGQVIGAGDPVIVVEAMKMQNELGAEQGGRVTEIKVKDGDVVEQDTLLVVMEPVGDET